MTVAAFGHIAIPHKRICQSSWWIDQPRQHFTKVAAQMTNTSVPIDDVSDREVQAMLQRSRWLAMGEKKAARHAVA